MCKTNIFSAIDKALQLKETGVVYNRASEMENCLKKCKNLKENG
jgi:hypothetical protein